jgi:O-antigen/teichoic acid export membrane protein
MANLNKIFDLLKKDTLAKQGLLLFSANFIFQSLNFFYQFAMGRLLGPADYGVLGVLFSIAYLLLAPINTIQTVLTKYITTFLAEKRLGAIKFLFTKSLRKIFIVSFITFIVFLSISYWLSKFLNIDNVWYIVVFGTFFLIAFITALVRGFLQGLQKFKLLGVNLLVEGASKLSIGIMLVLIGFKLYGAITAITLSLSLAFILGFVYLSKKMKTCQTEHFD